MKLHIVAIAVCLNLLLPIWGSCEERESEEITLSTIIKSESVLAMNYWDVDDITLLCLITLHSVKVDDNTYPDRRLTFYKKIGDKFNKLYQFKPGDYFLSMYPTSDNGNLVTVWVTGSAYRFYIFSFIDKEIKLVLDEGSKLMPEIVDIDNNGEDEILISSGNYLIDAKTKKVLSYPESTRIYKWNGKSYALIKTVPWKTRLNTP